ncbi:MAG: sugar phosphate isomerase/epimerase [Oscillospiraceae bacterium]|jgi:sugar phosphate isomerase/epimerase|nr:sugar phosphate isomerase/epimerase [Oscillospiraceae bacterium]
MMAYSDERGINVKHPFELCAFADEAADDLTGQIGALQKNGIGLLEIRGVDGTNIAGISIESSKRVRALLDNAGIRVWSIGSPSGKIGITDAFEPHLDEFRHMVELAEILGATHFRLFSFYGAQGSAAARDAVLERLSRFEEVAKGSNLVLCHENEKDIFGELAPACAQIHRALPGIKAIFDPANFIQAGQEVPSAWALLEPYVAYMHIKDARADGTVVPAGRGLGHIPELLEKYAAIGGRVLTLEPHLTVFGGLDELEHGTKTAMEDRYPTRLAAFEAAVSALKSLI